MSFERTAPAVQRCKNQVRTALARPRFGPDARRYPTKRVATQAYLPGFLCGESVRRDRLQSVCLGTFGLAAKKRRRRKRPIRLFREVRAYYSQEYRLNMLRKALRDAMHRYDMGVVASARRRRRLSSFSSTPRLDLDRSTGRGDAAARTWIFFGRVDAAAIGPGSSVDGSRRRRGEDVDHPWTGRRDWELDTSVDGSRRRRG